MWPAAIHLRPDFLPGPASKSGAGKSAMNAAAVVETNQQSLSVRKARKLATIMRVNLNKSSLFRQPTAQNPPAVNKSCTK